MRESRLAKFKNRSEMFTDMLKTDKTTGFFFHLLFNYFPTKLTHKVDKADCDGEDTHCDCCMEPIVSVSEIGDTGSLLKQEKGIYSSNSTDTVMCRDCLFALNRFVLKNPILKRNALAKLNPKKKKKEGSHA